MHLGELNMSGKREIQISVNNSRNVLKFNLVIVTPEKQITRSDNADELPSTPFITSAYNVRL